MCRFWELFNWSPWKSLICVYFIQIHSCKGTCTYTNNNNVHSICFPQTFSTIMNASIFNIHDCNLIDNATCNFDFTNSVFTSLLQAIVLTVFTQTHSLLYRSWILLNNNTFPPITRIIHFLLSLKSILSTHSFHIQHIKINYTHIREKYFWHQCLHI